MSKVSDFLAWLGGADLAILRQAPRDRGKYVQMGCVLLATSSIAAVSMTFAIHNTMGSPVPIAMIFGFFWGLVILNLDRFLVISMGVTRDKKRLWGVAVPRLLMAMVVSLVISTPITLEIFRSDIYAQITTMNLNESQQVASKEAKSDLQQRANAVQVKITADEAVLVGHLPNTVTSPQLQDAQNQVNQLQPQVAAAQSAVITAREAYQCELYGYGVGCAGGSGRAGYGPIAQAKKAAYDNAVTEYNSLNQQLTEAEATLSQAKGTVQQSQASALAADQQAARHELPGLKAQLATLQSQIKQQDNFDQANVMGNTGILRQLTALFRASGSNPVLLLAHLAVAALFFLIEVMPVAIKLLLNLGGPPTAYEQLLKAEDDKLVEAMKQERLNERRRRERESEEVKQKADAGSQARLTQALDMSKRQVDLGLKANDVVARKMEEILDVALEQWSAQVQAMLDGVQVPPGQQASAQAPGKWHAQRNGQGRGTGYGPGASQSPANGEPPWSGPVPGHSQPGASGQVPGSGQVLAAGQAAYNQPTMTTTPTFADGPSGNGTGNGAVYGYGHGQQADVGGSYAYDPPTRNGTEPPYGQQLGNGARPQRPDPSSGFGLQDPGDLL